MADEYKKIAGTETSAGPGVQLKFKDMTGYHALAVYLAEAISTTFSGDLPDTADGDLAAIAAALAGVLNTTVASVTLPSAVLADQVAVTSAGTAVPLTDESTSLTSGVRVKALADNTGTVYVGDENVAAATGYPLAAGEEVFVEINDLATVYVDAAEDGDAVAYLGS